MDGQPTSEGLSEEEVEAMRDFMASIKAVADAGVATGETETPALLLSDEALDIAQQNYRGTEA